MLLSNITTIDIISMLLNNINVFDMGCLCENKPKYLFHHLKHIFYHQNNLMIFYLSHMYQFHVICLVFFSCCALQLFLLNKTSRNSL